MFQLSVLVLCFYARLSLGDTECHLAVPLSVSCSVNGTLEIASVLIDDPLKGSSSRSRIAMNVSVSDGTVSFSRLNSVKLVSGNYSSDSQYALLGSLYDMQRLLSSMTYKASASLGGGSRDTITFSVARMTLQMGAWGWDHSPVVRDLQVDIADGVFASIDCPARLDSIEGNSSYLSVSVDWEDNRILVSIH